MSHSNSGEVIWTCKIGGPGVLLGGGNDLPMRQAIIAAYREVTGREPEFIFSGWGATLTEPERAVVEDRPPVCAACGLPFDERRMGDCEVCGA